MPETSKPLACELTDPCLAKVLKISELFRQLDLEVPGQLVSVFCFIASHNPCHQQAIQEALGLSANSASRNTDWLSKYHRLGKPGLDLVVKKEDPLNRRRKIVTLTPKGEQLVLDIQKIMSLN